MWHKFGLATLLALWALVPALAQNPRYFQYPNYNLPGSASPIVNNPPGRISPFPGNPGYLSPTMGPPLGNGMVPDKPGWAFGAEGGGVFQNTGRGTWTLSPNTGRPVQYLELYRSPNYTELVQPNTGTGIRLTSNALYENYGGVWYPIFNGWWQR